MNNNLHDSGVKQRKKVYNIINKMKRIEQTILEQIHFDGLRRYVIPYFEKSEDGERYYFLGPTYITKDQELNDFINIINEIANNLEKQYHEQLVALFFINLNRYLAYQNRYLIDNKHLDSWLLKEPFTANEVSVLTEEETSRTINIIVDGLYETHRIGLSTIGLNEDISEEDFANENYVLMPIINEDGVRLKQNGDVLEVAFHFASVAIFDELINQIKKLSLSSVQEQQCSATLNKFRKDALALTLKYIHYTDDLKEALNKASYDWFNFLGVDLKSIE